MTALFQFLHIRLLAGDVPFHFFLVGLKLQLENGDLSLQRLLPSCQFSPLPFDLQTALHRRRLLLRFLGQPCRTRENAFRPQVDLGELNALVGQQEFPDLVAMGHAAGFENVQPPVALAVEFDVAQEQPGVDERGNVQFRLLQGTPGMIQVREQGRDLTGLQVIDQPQSSWNLLRQPSLPR